jgi:hypothetical protein
VLLLRWRTGATDDEKRQAHEAVMTLPARIDVIRAWQVAVDDSTPSDEYENYDFVIIADFDSHDDYLAYRYHPYHIDVIERYTRPIVQDLARVQFTVGCEQVPSAVTDGRTADWRLMLDERAVLAAVTTLARAQNDRDWDTYRAHLADRVVIDQPLIDGWGGAREMTADEWMANGARYVEGFDATQHLLSNFAVAVTGDKATCEADALAVEQLDGETLTVGGRYHLQLQRASTSWLLTYRRFEIRFRIGDHGLTARAVARARGATS